MTHPTGARAEPTPAASPLPRDASTATLASLPGLRTLRSPGFRFILALALTAIGVIVLGAAMLRQASAPDGQFGIDFGDYHGAARALVQTGTPYAPEMLLGPVDAQGLERYRYPPPLAQLLVPLSGLPLGTAATIWLIAQAAATVLAVWLALGAAGVPRHAERAAWSAAACVVFLPVFDTLWKGNVSGFVAFQVALVALGGAAAGIGAVSATLLKVAPATLLPLLLPAGRRALVAAAATAVAIVGASLLLSPAAWQEYATVLPNLFGGSAAYATNLAPAEVARGLGVPEAAVALLRSVSLAAAVAATLMAPVIAWRRADRHGWFAGLTLAVAAMLLLPAAWWYHYLAALLPIAALAWPAARMGGRSLLLLGGSLIVFGVAWLPAATIGTAIVLSTAVTIHIRAPRVRAPRPAPAASSAAAVPATRPA